MTVLHHQPHFALSQTQHKSPLCYSYPLSFEPFRRTHTHTHPHYSARSHTHTVLTYSCRYFPFPFLTLTVNPSLYPHATFIWAAAMQQQDPRLAQVARQPSILWRFIMPSLRYEAIHTGNWRQSCNLPHDPSTPQ